LVIGKRIWEMGIEDFYAFLYEKCSLKRDIYQANTIFFVHKVTSIKSRGSLYIFNPSKLDNQDTCSAHLTLIAS
jgi:hypothetical protein